MMVAKRRNSITSILAEAAVLRVGFDLLKLRMTDYMGPREIERALLEPMHLLLSCY